MTVSEKEYIDALRAADQRALELLAKERADRIKVSILIISIIISISSVLVAVASLLHQK